MIETHLLYESAIRAIGAKKVANAMSLSLAYVYRLRQPPMAIDAESNGADRNDFDRVEALIDVLAAYPAGRPVLVLMRTWFNAITDRALGVWKPEPISAERRAAKTAHCLREFAEFIEAAGGGELDTERLQKEGADAIEAIERLMTACALGMEDEPEEVRRIG